MSDGSQWINTPGLLISQGDNHEECLTKRTHMGRVPAADSGNLLITAPCTASPPFPVSLPHGPTSAPWCHLSHKLSVLKSLSQSPLLG